MAIFETFEIGTQNRQVAVNTLAAVGFVTLVAGGIWLGVYSARFVPTAVTRFGSAAVSLADFFTPSPSTPSNLSVVPAASTTLPFENATSTASSTPAPATSAKTPAVSPAPGKESTSTLQIAGATTTPVFSGLPDLIVKIDTLGYLATSSADSFVASTTVPAGSRPAVKFTIKNVGTDVTGPWSFVASIPTQTAYLYHSQAQQSLKPGDSIQYTLGFDQANTGANQTVSITVNPDRAVKETNFDNDKASAVFTILGS